MSENQQKPRLKVTLCGLEGRAHTTLEMFISGPAQGVCDVVDESLADVAIFDLDGQGAERKWESFRARFTGPALLLSVTEKKRENAIWIPKPVNSKNFFQSIESIRDLLASDRAKKLEDVTLSTPPDGAPTAAVAGAEISPAQGEGGGVSRAAGMAWVEHHIHQGCGGVDDAVYTDLARRSEIFYQPRNYLHEILHRACEEATKSGKPVSVQVMKHQLIVLPDSRQVFTAMREQMLRPLSVTATPNGVGLLRPVDPALLPPLAPKDPHLYDYEAMLWMLAMWASRGRVPEGVDLDAPVRLKRWPNFPRLLISPHAMRIAALWTSQPFSLMQTAQQLDIPYRFVFSLFSACRALGLIEQLEVVAAIPSPAPALPGKPATQRSLIGSLLRKLKLTR